MFSKHIIFQGRNIIFFEITLIDLKNLLMFLGQYNDLATREKRNSPNAKGMFERDRTYIDKHWDYMIIFFVRDCGVSGGGDLNPLESGHGTGIYTVH